MKGPIFESPIAWRRGLLMVASAVYLAACASGPKLKELALASAEGQVVWACLQSSGRVVENKRGERDFFDGTTNRGPVSNLALYKKEAEGHKQAEAYVLTFETSAGEGVGTVYGEEGSTIHQGPSGYFMQWIVPIRIDPCSVGPAENSGTRLNLGF